MTRGERREAAVAAVGYDSPSAWAARRRDGTPAQRGVLVGLAAYLFASSLVDLHAYASDVVGAAALPSIAVRVVLGAVVV